MTPEHKITEWWNSDLGAWHCRAHYWDENGYSTKTCATPGEAQAFINACKSRKPRPNPDMNYEWPKDAQ